jgi:hypothetical protein
MTKTSALAKPVSNVRTNQPSLDNTSLAEDSFRQRETTTTPSNAWAATNLLAAPVQRRPQSERKTGLPDHLKAGIENLSGVFAGDINVHHNSNKPAKLQALAYTQGTDIHLGPGQEKHLPHEAWHVVQQKQGRVRPTLLQKGVAINDSPALELEADVMGARAVQLRPDAGNTSKAPSAGAGQSIVQRVNEPQHGQKTPKELAKDRLEKLLPGFVKTGTVNSEIIIPLPEDESGNCHGYTIHKNTHEFNYPENLIQHIKTNPDDHIAVFFKGGIGHSGRLENENLTHLVIGVGLVESTMNLAECAGYDQRCNLPEDKDKFWDLVKKYHDPNKEATIQAMHKEANAMIYAIEESGLTDEILNQTDNEASITAFSDHADVMLNLTSLEGPIPTETENNHLHFMKLFTKLQDTHPALKTHYTNYLTPNEDEDEHQQQ